MRVILALLFLAQFAAADFLEIRKVVEAGKGAKTYDDPQGGTVKLTVSDQLIAGDRHLATVWPMKEEGDRASVAVVLNAEGEQRMIAATKDGKVGEMRLAVIIDGKLRIAPVVNSVPLGKNFSIDTSSLEEAKALAGKLGEVIKPSGPASFEIRRVVEPGQGTFKVKLPDSGEELTLSDAVIVSRKHVANAWKDISEPDRHSVSCQLTEEGGKLMVDATKDGPPGKLRLAILFNGKVLSAPVVRSAPLGQNFVIELGSGGDAAAMANEIARQLKKVEE